MTGHGGNIYRFAEENRVSERLILDFSASINPFGLPESVIKAIHSIDSSMYHYPDPDTKLLKEVISNNYDIPSQSIICGNGSTELIYLCPAALRPKSVLIPAPTFSEYERACALSGARVKHFFLKRQDNFDLNPLGFINSMKGCEMAFICNPNNPTGRLIKTDDLLQIADSAKRFKCYLVIDEAFIDFLPEYSIIKEVQNNPYLIVLRSMTKFYALSAIRLGFGIFHPSIVNKILKYKEPWTVNSIAQIAGITALKDEKYKTETLKRLTQGKNFMEEGFKRLSIQYLPSSVNYYLLEMKDAQHLISSLRKTNIMVRDCSNFKGLNGSYIRIAVKSKQDNEKLLMEISRICVQS